MGIPLIPKAFANLEITIFSPGFNFPLRISSRRAS
jgi:hypothetical protein